MVVGMGVDRVVGRVGTGNMGHSSMDSRDMGVDSSVVNQYRVSLSLSLSLSLTLALHEVIVVMDSRDSVVVVDSVDRVDSSYMSISMVDRVDSSYMSISMVDRVD